MGLVALTTAEALSSGVTIVDLSALAPQPGNLFVRLCKAISRHDRNRMAPHLVAFSRMF
jgi:hypothetical protein